MALLVLILALVVLREELREYRYHEIVQAARRIPARRILVAALATVLSYATLVLYDALALRYVRRPLPLRRLAFGSFIAYALSQTLGFPLLTGGSVRLRFWTAWGLSASEIAQGIGFAGTTFTLGLVALGGAALLAEPVPNTEFLGISLVALRPIGAVLVLGALAYVTWAIIRGGRVIRLWGWEFAIPSGRQAVAQLGVATLDWAVAAAVLYALLPASQPLSFVTFAGAFVLAQVLGVVSHVPGGLGVFETIMVLLLRGNVPADRLLGALVVYRIVYYFAPFVAAVLLLSSYEALRRRVAIAKGAGIIGSVTARWVPAVLPVVLSVSTFVAGAVLLFSGATPSLHPRVATLHSLVPLGLIEISHFTASIAGAALLVLAWAIRRRLDAAYALTIAVLLLGIVTSLLKGLDWEEALLLAAVLAAVVPSRHVFYRRAALTAEPFTPTWIVAVTGVVGITIWLGVFSYQHVEYSHSLWWRFTARGDAPRFLRATAGASIALLLVAWYRLLAPARAEPELPSGEELKHARTIVAQSASTTANLALLGDKALMFSDHGDAFIMYGVEGRSWVALGDPVGSDEDSAEVAWRFREEADRHGAWTVFYEVGVERLPLYLDLGLTLTKLGEEAHVDLRTFSMEGGSRKNMRRNQREFAKAGATFEIAPREEVPSLLPALRCVSDSWLTSKNTREKGFSLGRFDDEYLKNFPVALVRLKGEVVAFANLWLSGGHAEVSPDLMRFSEKAPPAVMDYLFVELILWAQAQGYENFNLGMAPLSGLADRRLAPLRHRAGSLLFKHAEHFYNFQGLRQYKEKYDPIWTPRYLASPGGLILPRVVTNVASLVSRGITGLIRK